MNKKPESADVLHELDKLAFGKANDAVRLIFLGEGDEALLENLDLSLLSEVKRGANGMIEVKLLNRLDALELLANLVGAGAETHREDAERFYRAMDEAAARIGEEANED